MKINKALIAIASACTLLSSNVSAEMIQLDSFYDAFIDTSTNKVWFDFERVGANPKALDLTFNSVKYSANIGWQYATVAETESLLQRLGGFDGFISAINAGERLRVDEYLNPILPAYTSEGNGQIDQVNISASGVTIKVEDVTNTQLWHGNGTIAYRNFGESHKTLKNLLDEQQAVYDALYQEKQAEHDQLQLQVWNLTNLSGQFYSEISTLEEELRIAEDELDRLYGIKASPFWSFFDPDLNEKITAQKGKIWMAEFAIEKKQYERSEALSGSDEIYERYYELKNELNFNDWATELSYHKRQVNTLTNAYQTSLMQFQSNLAKIESKLGRAYDYTYVTANTASISDVNAPLIGSFALAAMFGANAFRRQRKHAHG